jgi:hypothetical protein
MIYDRLTDEALADRLVRIAGDVRTFPVVERQEILAEAAKRLIAKDEKLKQFKERVRERAIEEADRRGWCGEFDDIIRAFGLAGRWSNYHVTVSYLAFNRNRTSQSQPIYLPGKQEATKACIARSIDHANQLVKNYYERHQGYVDVEVVRTVRDSDVMGSSGPRVSERDVAT